MGTIEKFEIFMPQLMRYRNVEVYLPNDYYENTEKNYPTLYMNDGQNLFFDEESFGGNSWKVKESLEMFELMYPGHEVIVVGIYNFQEKGRRFDEYSPWPNEFVNKALGLTSRGIAGGEGKLYADFIVNTLKPFIDNQYRTLRAREHTSILGSSMGGLISLYTGLAYDEVFSYVGAFSTASWFSEDSLINYIDQHVFRYNHKFYFCVGTEETSDKETPDFPQIYLACTQKIRDALIKKGVTESDISIQIDIGEMHSEKYWSKRFPDFIKWLHGYCGT